jgi:hypothetical protein
MDRPVPSGYRPWKSLRGLKTMNWLRTVSVAALALGVALPAFADDPAWLTRLQPRTQQGQQ